LTIASSAAWVFILVGVGFTFVTSLKKLIGHLCRIQIVLLLGLIIVGTIYVITRSERRVIEEDKESFGSDEGRDGE
jgi:membrane protein DedA with SNARE-associated domain